MDEVKPRVHAGVGNKAIEWAARLIPPMDHGVAVAATSADRRLTPQLRNRENEASITLVAVEIGTVPKAVELVLHAPADVPGA